MLEGKLVRLRAREPDDVERAYTWINDRVVTQFLTARYPLSRADEQRWLEGTTSGFADGVHLAVDTLEGVHIGNIDLTETRAEDRKAGLGVMIGEKKYWSNGYGTDAIVTLLRFAFEEMNLNRVWLTALEFNDRAIACYKKCGFQEEGRLRQELFSGGRYHDLVAMGVLRDEFAALYGTGATSGEGDRDA